MHIRSLGIATDLEIAATRGSVIDRDDYLVLVTPDDPTYYHGNALVLPAAPQVGEVAHWTRRFERELDHAEIRHVALRWDGVTGDTGASHELANAGFTVEVSQVMSSFAVRAPLDVSGIRIARLSPDELPAVAESEYRSGDRHDEIMWQFLLRRASWKRSLVERDLAALWGAYDGAQLVASLGLVPLGRRARYLDVHVATTHRARGIAAAMLARAAEDAGDVELVIIAEPGSPAARVYERVGFHAIERIASACRVRR